MATTSTVFSDWATTADVLTGTLAEYAVDPVTLASVIDVSGGIASKSYVDSLAAGLKWKSSVKVATTANGTLASAFANGQTVDGVVLSTGDRILLKNQSTGSENGIYTAPASGAPTRATDADTGPELVQAACFVEQGTVNADKAFVCTNDSITLGSTAVAFVGFASTLGALLASNDLSDLGSASTSRNNLGASAGVWPVSLGGTGTGTAHPLGSVIYADSSGIYSADANIKWDSVAQSLNLGGATDYGGVLNAKPVSVSESAIAIRELAGQTAPGLNAQDATGAIKVAVQPGALLEYAPQFVQVGSVTVANTAAETPIIAAGVGSVTPRSTYWATNKGMRIRASGRYGTAASAPTLTIRLKLGATTALTLTGTLTGSVTTKRWHIDCQITALHPVFAVASGIWHSAATELEHAALPYTVQVIAGAVGLTAQWGAANAANTISCDQLTIEAIGI